MTLRTLMMVMGLGGTVIACGDGRPDLPSKKSLEGSIVPIHATSRTETEITRLECKYIDPPKNAGAHQKWLAECLIYLTILDNGRAVPGRHKQRYRWSDSENQWVGIN